MLDLTQNSISVSTRRYLCYWALSRKNVVIPACNCLPTTIDRVRLSSLSQIGVGHATCSLSGSYASVNSSSAHAPTPPPLPPGTTPGN